MTRGEILADYDGATGEVSVFTIDYEGKTLKLKILTESTISKLIGKPITDDLRLAVTFRVSSGMSLIMIGVNQNLFLVDPFTGMLHQKLEVPDEFVYVFDVKMNWCSNEIVVLYRNNFGKYFIKVFPLGHGGLVKSCAAELSHR